MSKIRTAAISAAAVIGLAVHAGAQVPAKQDSTHRDGHHGQMDGRRGGMHRERHGFGRRGGFNRGGMRGGEGRLMKDLNLSDAQKSKIKTIHEKYRPQFEALRNQARTQFESLRSARQKGDTSAEARQKFQAERQQFQQKAQALRMQEQNEIRAVLTADQRAKWDAAAKQRQDRMKERRGNRSKA